MSSKHIKECIFKPHTPTGIILHSEFFTCKAKLQSLRFKFSTLKDYSNNNTRKGKARKKCI